MRTDGLLAHTAEEKANLLVLFFACNSRFDATMQTPPTLPRFDVKVPVIVICQKETLKSLHKLDVVKGESLAVSIDISKGQNLSKGSGMVD